MKMNVTNKQERFELGDIIELRGNFTEIIREGIEVEGGMIDVPILWGAVAGSVTFYSAYLSYFTADYTGTRVLLLGGGWRDGGRVSLVFSDGGFAPSGPSVYVGSRLIRS